MLSVNASDIENIEYKNVKNNSKIIYNQDKDIWSQNINRKEKKYFIKKQSLNGESIYTSFDNTLSFSTECQYEFLENGNLIGYSNKHLKFYDFAIVDNELTKRELSAEEIQALFPQYKIIKLSEFSKNTNSLKIKKDKHNFKIILLNDTENKFDNYSFSTNNAKFEKYQLIGFLNIHKKGMILFSNYGENSETTPWYVLLIR